MKSNETIDFLAIGDTVIDHFIHLKDASINCDIDTDACTISMNWGDKIPYEKVDVTYAVGNSANASISASRLGLKSALMSHLGKDQNGELCLQSLRNDGVNTEFTTQEDGKSTNVHYVLSYDAERTILINHTDFTYNLAKQLEGKPIPKWVYFSSVRDDSMPYHSDIAKWIKENDIKLAFQPGTFQISLGKKLKEIYEVTEVFFCNVSEAKHILEIEKGDIIDILKEIHALGPKIVCITDGPKGSYMYDGNDAWFHPMYPDPAPPVERTGAGDSFSSTFTVALSLGKTPLEALSWGPVNSMNVVQYVGAQKGLLSRPELEKYLENAPKNYIPKKLT